MHTPEHLALTGATIIDGAGGPRHKEHAVIIAGTLGAAHCIGLAVEVGSIAPGKMADLIAAAGDPLEEISVMQDVQFVMKSGQMVRAGMSHPKPSRESEDEPLEATFSRRNGRRAGDEGKRGQPAPFRPGIPSQSAGPTGAGCLL